jgi:iron complex transport system ATP-binding protein
LIRLSGVSVRRAGQTLLGPIDWAVGEGERWVIVGPNGSGKTTLVEIAGTSLWPTTGSVEVLGEKIGTVDARDLRRRIGYAGSALERDIPGTITAHDVVLTARAAAFAPWWHTWQAADHVRADGLLERLRIAHLAGRPFGVLSTGERRRALIARALMPDPELLILDEPGSSLDLAAREGLVRDLAMLAEDPRLRAILLVTHHLEEIPPGFSHALVLSAGRAVAAGPLDESLTGEALSTAFGLQVVVDRLDGRFFARGTGAEEAFP